MNNVADKLYNILGTKFNNTDIKTLDSKGKETIDMEEIEMFSFDFLVDSRNYGPVVILLSANENLEVYYGNNTSKSLDINAKKKWENLIEHLSTFARTNRLGFSLKHTTDLKYDLSNITDITDISESYRNIFEGYYGTSKTSYNKIQEKAKIIIRHSKIIGEDDKRFRNISALFIENADGERFKLPFTKLTGARAMARHVTEGGNPYDLFGVHICEMVKDINTLGGFVRRSKCYEGNEEALALVETGRAHYNTMRKGLKQIAGKRGYHTFKESWEPSAITEMEQDTTAIRSLFTEKTVNSRVEDALPLLARLQQMAEERDKESVDDFEIGPIDGHAIGRELKGLNDEPPGDWADEDDMDELKEFEDWANNIVEGTWSIPETPKQLAALKQWLSQERPLGVDGMNATEALYNIIGDDDLFDELEDFAKREPDSDARPFVINWIKDAIINKDFANPNALKNLRQVVRGVKEGFEGDLDADTEDDLNASFNKDMDTNVRQESTKKDTEMKPFTEYVAEAEADEIEEVVETEEVDEAEETETKEWKKPWEKDDKEDDKEDDDKEEVTETGAPLVAMDDQNDLGALMQRTNFLLNK